MNILLVKTVLGTVSAFGASAIVGNVAKIVTPVSASILKKTMMYIGGIGLGTYAGGKAIEGMDTMVDNAVSAIKRLKDQSDKIFKKEEA